MFCCQKNFSNPTLPVDEAQFYALVTAKQWNENIDKYRETGEASLKRKLPAFIFQATFDETTSKTGKTGAWRKQSATRLTGLVVMDIDHVEDPRAVFEGWGIGDPSTTLGMTKGGARDDKSRILLVYVTPSGKGLKVVAMAKVLDVEVDECCRDSSRMSYVCKESDILYLDKELFTYENKAFSERYTALYRDGHSQATNEDASSRPHTPVSSRPNGVSGEISPCATLSRDDRGNRDDRERKSFKGIPYAEIIAEWWKQNGGEPQEGERNVKLYQLAVSLRAICDNNKSLLMEVMPRLGLDEEEMRAIIDSACKEPPKGISKALQSVLAVVGDPSATLGMTKEGLGMTSPLSSRPNEVSGEISPCAALSRDDRGGEALEMTRLLWEWGAQIEALSEDYPIIKDITKGLKKKQYPAALFVAGGLLMTLMTRCTYRFYHRPEELRRLNNSTLIIGDPASGKSFATRLFKLLASPIVAADQVGKDAINAYREQMRTKGANKEKPKKPKVVVRIHPARTSNAQFIQDMVNAKEEVDGEPMQLHMLTFDTELDNTLSLQKGGAYIDKQALQLKAFHNEEDGQAYSNVDSVFQEFYVIWNYIYTGTPIALKKMVNEQNFGSGLATRLTCIPLPATKYQMMAEEETVDYESDERLKAWAGKLDRMKGELTVKSLVHELYLWTARRMADAEENDSQADEMLLKRCAYHGLNFSAPFIVMRHWDQMKQDGQFWCGSFETDEVDWRLAELIVNIQYACQRHFFGRMAVTYFENKNRDASVNVRRSQKTIECFNRLPEEFTIEDVMRCFSLPIESARVRANRLVADKVAVKSGQFKENGSSKSKYRKTGVIML